MSSIYKSDFEKFLSHTKEKEILLSEILKDVKKYSVDSILDIGAGNGLISIPLAKHVKTFQAVERNQKFVKKLSENGIHTTQAEFPTKISGSFDLVLASHVISYQKSVYEDFIHTAWNLVKPDKVFLVITYRSQEDDWTSLISALGQKTNDFNRVGYNKIVELLFSLGEVKIRKVTTSVETNTLNDMIDALSFVASDGLPERKEKFLSKRAVLEKILNSKYRTKKGFIFPFQHFFITVIKNKL